MKNIDSLVIILIAATVIGCVSPTSAAVTLEQSTEPAAEMPGQQAVVQQAVPDVDPAEQVATQQPTEAAAALITPTPQQAESPFKLSECPTPAQGETLYASEENGICFVYPSEYVQLEYFERPEDGVTISEASAAAGGFSLVNLSVTFNGPAAEADSEEYYEEWTAQVMDAAVAPLDVPQVEKKRFNTYNAIVVYGLSAGMGQSRRAFIIENGARYSLELTPDLPPEFQDANVDELWEMVTSSIVLFGPTTSKDVVTAEDVCPVEVPDTNLLINEAEGYCYLYPFDYQVTELFSGGVQGGSVLDRSPNAPEVRNRIVVSQVGPANESSAIQLLEPRLTIIDETTVQDMTSNIYDGVQFIDERGPYQSRQAIIVANGYQYTIIQQPYDPLIFPDAVEEFEALWGTVTGSIAFFDPFR